MDVLNKNVVPARFEVVDLKSFATKDLKALLSSSNFTANSQKIASFRADHKINSILNSEERRVVSEALKRLAEEELTKIVDVHAHYLNKGPCFFTPIGLQTTNERLNPEPWVVPEDLKPQKPAVSLAVGMTIALCEIENVSTVGEGASVQVKAKDDFTQLLPLKYHGLDVTGMAAAAPIVADLVEPKIQSLGKLQGGRDLIEKVTDALEGMTNEQYLLYHYILCAGPFSNHFTWGVLKSSNVVQGVVQKKYSQLPARKPGYRQKEVILGVKQEYAMYYQDFSKCKTAQELRKAGNHFEKMYIWSKGFVPQFQIPVLTVENFANVYKFMNDCRNFRGTDDKGLSGYSCGFGSTGNPTKIQARLQRKLAIILGAAQMSMTGPVIVKDYKESELPLIGTQVRLWRKNSSVLLRNILFITNSTSTRINAELADLRYDGQNTADSTEVIFPEAPSVTAKGSEWAKMETVADNALKLYFPKPKPQQTPLDEPIQHRIVGTLLYAKTYFLEEHCKPYVFGSIHNMYGYMSNKPVYCAVSDGTREFHLDKVELPAQTAVAFIKTVCLHNGHRTGYFLRPQYFFNPKLNFLRHVKGKSFNFEDGKVTDVEGFDPQVVEDGEFDDEDQFEDEEGQEVLVEESIEDEEDEEEDSDESASTGSNEVLLRSREKEIEQQRLDAQAREFVAEQRKKALERAKKTRELVEKDVIDTRMNPTQVLSSTTTLTTTQTTTVVNDEAPLRTSRKKKKTESEDEEFQYVVTTEGDLEF